MWVIALLALFVVRQYSGGPHEGLVVIIGLLAAAMVMCWVGALDRLARQNDWCWFACVLMLHLVGLGVVGMAAYRLAGPVDVELTEPGIE